MFKPIKNNPLIDSILLKYERELGIHLDKYKNHVYRVYNFCLLLDSDKTNYKKYAVAVAFHDLGIWTANTFDYLIPSISLTEKFLIKKDKSECIEEISLMIDMHHKRNSYSGNHEKLIETFRQADCIDVTLGIKKYGLSKNTIHAVQKTFQNKGFHWFLVTQTLRNFFKNPSNPLPMFKK